MTQNDIHAYARCNMIPDLERAISEGAEIDLKDEFGSTALHYAIALKNLDAVSVLLALGADVMLQNRDGKTALHGAVEYKLPQVAEALIRKNPAVIAVSDKHGNQPLWTAAFNARGNYDIVSLLLRYGGDVEHRNNVDLSPLDIPKRLGEPTLLKLLEKSLRRTKGSKRQSARE